MRYPLGIIVFLALTGGFLFAGGDKEEAEEPVRLTVGFRSGEALDSLQVNMNWKSLIMGNEFWPIVYEQLWVIGPPPEYDPVPRLATSWETEDNKTWIFHLDERAMWQDGTPLTAEDVGFTLKYLPQADPSYLGPGSDVESYEVIDDHTVKIVLKAAVCDGKYPVPLWTPILPKHIFEDYKDDFSAYPNDNPVGSGPFKVKEFAPSEYIWFEKDENYWGEPAGVDEILFKVFGSDDALYGALKSGDIDMLTTTGCSPMMAEELEAHEDITVIESPGLVNYWLSFNTYSDTPLKDKAVRQAIMYSIDREKIIDLVYRGYAEEAYSFIYPEMDTYNPDVPKYEFDLDKAASLLDEAGYTDTDNDGLRNDPDTGENVHLEIMVPSAVTMEVKMATVIKEQVVKAGLDVEVKAVDLATFWEFLYDPWNDGYQIAISGGDPGPNGNWVWEFARSTCTWNTSAYENAEFDEVLADMVSEQDITKQTELIKELQAIVAEDVPYGLLVRPAKLDPVRTDRLEGWVKSMGGLSSYVNPWTFWEVRPKE